MIRAGFLLLFGGAHLCAAQADSAHAHTRTGTIDGIVSDTGLAPLEGATISLLGTPVSVVTGTNGRFRMLGVREGDYLVIVRRLGFEGATTKVVVEPENTARVAFTLNPIVRRLAGVEVFSRPAFTPRMADFYERREHAIGHFITRGEIDARNPVRTYELFNAIPSVYVQLTKTGGGVVKSTRSGCSLQVLVDGLPIDPENFPAPNEIGGIEVYSGPATVPLQYKSKQAGCGLILIWTGDGR